MEITPIQAVLVILVSAFYLVQKSGFQLIALMSVFTGWATGLILGDANTGLLIGSTMQLMGLGLAGIGGASIPDYPIAAIIGTVVAILTDQDQSVGVTIGVAVGMLCVQIDVIVKIINGFLVRKAKALALEGKTDAMRNVLWVCPCLFAVAGAFPTFIMLVFGVDAVNFILNVMPAWFTTGLSIAGGVLPVVGIALLLNYMPTKKFISFVIVGFLLAAYLKLSILPIALFGFAAAYEHYKSATVQKCATSANTAVLEDE
jgi:PTS system mannose-specific IIC component